MYISHDTETAGDWQTSRVTFTRGDPFRIIVDAFIPFTGEAAIKTIRVTSGQCDMRKSFDLIGSNDVEGESSATLSPILCTFETDKCDFFDGSLQSLRWLAADQLDAFDAALNNMSNQMPPPDAARPTDHTTGTSRGRVLAFQVTTNALYMDATTSLTLPDRVNRCVSFWLQVNAMCSVHWQTNTINGSTLLWFYSPTYPDREWYRFEFEIGTAQDDIHGDIRLTFQTNCRSGYQSGFVALDDVEIRAGSCAQDHFCNFEQDNCGWQSISSTSTQSNLTYLTTQNEETHVNLSHRRVQRMLAKHQLPYFDSTTRSENGHFLEIPNGVTAFRSPKIRFNENVKEYCLNFYYYYGIFGSQLELPVLIGTGDQRLLLQLGTLILTKTDGWNLATLTIKPDLDLWSSKRLKQLSQTLKSDDERNAYKFYSVWDKYWNVYILFDLKLAMSVDDISIEKGICESSSVFYCDSGLTVSVSRNKVCNQHVDCWNGADEINCGSCVFNQTLCEYQQVKKAMGSFEMASANSKVDLGRIRYPSDSNYLYTKGLNGTPMNQFAGIVSPTIQRTYRRCRLSFDYAIDNVRLMVGIRFLNEITFRIVWMDLKDHLEPVSVTIPLRSLRSPFKIEFRAVSRIGSGYAVLSNLRMMDCEMLDTRNDPAYRVAYEAVDGSNVDHPVEWKDVGEIPSTLSEHLLDSARQRWFQCSNGNRISAELSCNYEDDCEDNSDELSYLCDKRAVRMSFNEPNVATAGVQMSGFVIHQPLSGFLSLPNLDHTRSDTIGYAMIASKASLQWSSFMQPNLHSKSTLHATGLITIDLLVIQGTCSLRFAYWKRGDDIRLSVKWREIVGEPVRGSKSIELLEPQQDWQLIQVPLHEFIGNRVVRLSLQAQLSHNSNAILLLDDLSTSADCHKLSSNPLKCTLLGRKSENCGWHLEASSLANRSVELADKLMKKIKLNPLIDVAQFYTALQVRPRTDLISRRGTTTGVFRMQSLRIPFDLGSKFSITFEYRLQAFGRVDVYLLDLVNQKHLLHIQHQSSSAYERICFSLKEHTIRTTEHLELQVQLQGRHSEFWLKEIMPSLLECDPSNLCDFSSQSYERQCQYMTDQSPFGSHHFLNSLSDPLFQLPDHSLHSDASGFLYAKSSQSGSSDQSYRLELSSDSSIYGSCIQFAYTSGRIDGHTGRLIQTASDSLQSDSFGEIELKMMKVNNLKPLFKLSSNLNWQWRSATILVPRRIKPELQFVATFRANQLNTSFDQVFAIDDIRIADMQTARTLCRVGTCAFDSESMCGWTNPMSDLPLLANGNHDLHDHDVDLAFALPNPQQVSWVLIESLSDLFENFPSPALNSSKPGIGAVFDKLNQTAQLVSVQRTYGQLSERLTIRCNASPRSVFEVRVLQKEGNRQRTLNVSQIGGSDDWRKIKVMLPHLRSEQQATHTVIEVRSLRSTTSREAEKGKSTAFVISDIVIQKVLSSSEDVDDEQDDDEKMRRQQDGGQEWQQDVVVIREPLDQHPTSGHSSRSPALHSKWFVSFAVVIWLQLILLLV